MVDINGEIEQELDHPTPMWKANKLWNEHPRLPFRVVLALAYSGLPWALVNVACLMIARFILGCGFPRRDRA